MKSDEAVIIECLISKIIGMELMEETTDKFISTHQEKIADLEKLVEKLEKENELLNNELVDFREKRSAAKEIMGIAMQCVEPEDKVEIALLHITIKNLKVILKVGIDKFYDTTMEANK